MIWVFFFVLIVASAFLVRKKTVGRKAWITMIVLGTLFSFLVAYISISNVWTPHPLSDDVFLEQDYSGNYRGTLPWSQFSYPLTLTVFHTPLRQVTIDQDYEHGKAEFSIDFAGFSLVRVKGNFSYLYGVMGPMPMNYEIDSIFSRSPEFFGSLVALLTVFNCLAAFGGIILANALSRMRWHHEIRN